MERIFDEKKVAACIAKSKYHSVLDTIDIDFYLTKYEKKMSYYTQLRSRKDVYHFLNALGEKFREGLVS